MRRVCNQRDRVVGQLCCAVCGHQKMMLWPVCIAGSIKTFQGPENLGPRRRGVHAIAEPGKCTRELLSRLPRPDGGLQRRQVSPENLGNWVSPGLRPLGSPLEGDHDHLCGQGLFSKL